VTTSEEEHADEVLAELARLDMGSAEFGSMFSDFESAVAAHAAQEEADEFPRIRAGLDREHLVAMGQDCWQPNSRQLGRECLRQLRSARRPGPALARTPGRLPVLWLG
jgi:hypothetical protein